MLATWRFAVPGAMTRASPISAFDASHAGTGTPRTRQLCAYPNVAVYDGSGDVTTASNFKCKRPRR